MGTIAQVVSNFDLVAIQEVRRRRRHTDSPARRLAQCIGRTLRSDRQRTDRRRSITRSAYAFVWDDTRVKLVQNSAYVVHDNHQRMYREPMVASFETRAPPATGPQRPFRFTMINAHTDPDNVAPTCVENEINVLDDVFVRVRQYEFETAGEEDCILVGDLNVDTKRSAGVGVDSEFDHDWRRHANEHAGHGTYDHILIDRNMTREYTGRFGVIDFQRDLGLSEQQALLISDHMPLWAEFSAYEVPQVESVTSAGTRMIR